MGSQGGTECFKLSPETRVKRYKQFLGWCDSQWSVEGPCSQSSQNPLPALYHNYGHHREAEKDDSCSSNSDCDAHFVRWCIHSVQICNRTPPMTAIARASHLTSSLPRDRLSPVVGCCGLPSGVARLRDSRYHKESRNTQEPYKLYHLHAPPMSNADISRDVSFCHASSIRIGCGSQPGNYLFITCRRPDPNQTTSEATNRNPSSDTILIHWFLASSTLPGLLYPALGTRHLAARPTA